MQRVFVVEDHAAMRQMLLDFLGIVPDVSVCGAADTVGGALVGIEAVRPTVLVSDVSLPDGNGIELVREVRRRWPDVRCLVLTGHPEPIYRERALAAGAHGFLIKGDPERLLEAVGALVAGGAPAIARAALPEVRAEAVAPTWT
jgi:DNA-binding NarL/FixJ family response regulator